VNGPQDIFVREVDGSGDAKEVLKFDNNLLWALSLAVSPEGKFLAYVVLDPKTSTGIYIKALKGDQKPQPFLHTPARETAHSFSPDGR
jgi:Tol biopolymer transport system component